MLVSKNDLTSDSLNALKKALQESYFSYNDGSKIELIQSMVSDLYTKDRKWNEFDTWDLYNSVISSLNKTSVRKLAYDLNEN